MCIRNYLSLLALVFLLNACSPMPNDGIPVYVRIDSVELITQAGQGGNSHFISELWMESDADNLGAYEYPVKIPVLREGEFPILAQAGVIMNGLSSIRYRYPFYFPDTVTVKAERGTVFYWTPRFRYKSGTVFALAEDFESTNFFTGGFDVVSSTADPLVRYGQNAGRIIVQPADSTKEVKQYSVMSVSNGGEVWGELDYYTELPITVGLYITGNGQTVKYPKINFFPSEGKWKKVYINFSPEVNSYSGFTYQVYIEAINLQNSGGKVYFDNIKFLHFN